MMVSILKRTAVVVLLAASLGVATAAVPPLRLALILPGGSAALSVITATVQLHGCKNVETAATGKGTIEVHTPDGAVKGSISTTGVRHATAAGIYQDGYSKSIIPLKRRGSSDTWDVPAKAKLTQAQINRLVSRQLSVIVKSAAHHGGELCGQLIPVQPPAPPSKG